MKVYERLTTGVRSEWAMLKKFFQRLLGKRGFTILESILTVGILAAGLFGGLTVMQNSVAHTVNGDFNSIGMQLANERIEAIMADAEFRGYDFVIEVDNAADVNVSPEYPSITRVVTISEVNAADLTTHEEGSGIKKIDVTVSWGNRAHQNVTTSTLISDVDN